MERNWLDLWRELVITTSHPRDSKLVSKYETHARRREERLDPLLDFILENINSETTIIDIGAGSGRWTIPLSKIARSVTAIEPSAAMVNMLQGNLVSARVSNVEIIQSSWEEAVVQPHDIIVCAHAMYASSDLEVFVRKVEQYARKRCYLAIRLPSADGIIGELSLSIYGHRHDSPNAIVAYNALYAMGIYANVLVESNNSQWTDTTLEQAFDRAKRHLHLGSSTTYDNLMRETLARRLSLLNNTYLWPDGMRSALLWWSPPAII